MIAQQKSQGFGILLLVSAAVLWGLIGPVSKLIFSHGMPPLESAFWRGVLAGLAFFINWLAQRYPLPKTFRDWFGIVVFGVFGVALLEGSFVLAVHHGGAALASILLYSAPIWVNLASLLLFKETIPKRRWIALGLTLVGVVGLCLLGGAVSFSVQALTWGLLAGISYAAFYVSGKVFFTRLHPVTVYMIAFPVASLVILPVTSMDTGKSPIELLAGVFHYPPVILAACLFVGIIATYLPYLLYGTGLRLVDAGRAAIITTVEPVVAVIVASLALGESFTVLGYMFSLTVLLGVAMS